ncbi:carboxymuconolactone decarboxylase family protein [Lipingzhangella sp. LS1_29]|uniref:Carboxymuconolactone decarboxylase family protein n=1 Tax=Lipingzhangella rawalii TaxID=2055835 RepID=A0ABU2H524_9ACTN|nr:carboxymuconolactone decarboxylase family protein [Lipingzhangella rawalii]MDS1269915.1 carboxymuconolactone decarboxylase family protein [Lipingzhangella rawalii]
MRHGHLHWYTPAELTPRQRAIYDGVRTKYGSNPPFPLTDAEGRLHGPFNAMLAAPGVGAALQHLSAAVAAETSLPARLRELVILAVATQRDSEFEWFVHRRVALRAGVEPTEIDTLAQGGIPASADAGEQATLEVVRCLLSRSDIAEEHRTTLQDRFGEAALVEVTTLVGYYELLATLLRALAVPMPEPPEEATSATQPPEGTG